jgi:hypothetical protein
MVKKYWKWREKGSNVFFHFVSSKTIVEEK